MKAPHLIADPHRMFSVNLNELQPVVRQVLDVVRSKRLPPLTAIVVLSAAMIHICDQFGLNMRGLFRLYPHLRQYMITHRFVRPYLEQQGGWDAMGKKPLGEW